MPRQRNKHRNIEIVITPEAINEALAMWVTEYHGIEIDHKQIEIYQDDKGQLTAKITKRAKVKSEDQLPETEISPQDSNVSEGKTN